jgi:hypothetical protein
VRKKTIPITTHMESNQKTRRKATKIFNARKLGLNPYIVSNHLPPKK